ncbi:hypothetical protein SE18_23005 [Herpetosiphon geysericola]|uniref:Uncharacterized protein n=1 Tax=Herpetosiphon geysericola TaxID=70996 RepID=A0A0P6XYJ0_9CHLR|nr:hypothetical protein SE18_23005 [Herpetosiphon geysericola]
MQGDENPLRLPPAEGRKGGERGASDQRSGIRKHAKITKGRRIRDQEVLTQRRREIMAYGYWNIISIICANLWLKNSLRAL